MFYIDYYPNIPRVLKVVTRRDEETKVEIILNKIESSEMYTWTQDEPFDYSNDYEF